MQNNDKTYKVIRAILRQIDTNGCEQYVEQQLLQNKDIMYFDDVNIKYVEVLLTEQTGMDWHPVRLDDGRLVILSDDDQIVTKKLMDAIFPVND